MEEIIGYDALYQSMEKCKAGVSWKNSVAHFLLNAPNEIEKLEYELKSGNYKERKKKTFTVLYPKEREIVSISFRDRVYQRSLNDNAVYPGITPHLIYDNGACQKGKGTDFVRKRLKVHLMKQYRESQSVWVLKMDIHHYYQSMRHELAKSVFKKYLPDDVYRLAEKVLDSYEGDTGYNPGSQMIQIAGISALNGIDHAIKEQMRVKHYIRYMDDMILMAGRKEVLEEWQKEIGQRLSAIGFELNQKKCEIVEMKKGFMFLGFQYRMTESGKILMSVDPAKVKAERRKLKKLVRLAKDGKLAKDKVEQCYQSWKAHASKGDSYGLIQRMDEYYQSLWR